MSTSPKAQMTSDAAFDELVVRLRESGISDDDTDEHLSKKVGGLLPIPALTPNIW